MILHFKAIRFDYKKTLTEHHPKICALEESFIRSLVVPKEK